jgi:hypothetical protein
MRAQVDEVVELSRADSFRKQAEACELKAEQAIDPMDGQLWSLLANQWCQLARYVSSAAQLSSYVVE